MNYKFLTVLGLSLSISLVASSAFSKNIDTGHGAGRRDNATSSVSGPVFGASGSSGCFASNQEQKAKQNALDFASSVCAARDYVKAKRISKYDFEYACGRCISYHNPEGRCVTEAYAEFRCSM